MARSICRVLVTGASGFLGRAVCRLLGQDPGLEIVGVSRSRPDVEGCDEMFGLDLTTASAWQHLSRYSYDMVIHLAAEIPGTDQNGFHLFADNVAMAYHLNTFCRDVRPKKLVYGSSVAVYPIASAMSFQEEVEPMPATAYGIAKLAGEHFVRLCNQWCNSVSCLRFSSIYGPGTRRYHEKTVLNVFMNQAVSGNALIIHGQGKRTQDFLYVTDAAAGVVAALYYTLPGMKIFNIASGCAVTMSELAMEIIKCFGQDDKKIQYDTSLGEGISMSVNIDRAKSELYFTPLISLREGLRIMRDAWIHT